jgi:DNA mismatch repair ATPase MutS
MQTIIETIKNIPDVLRQDTMIYFHNHILNDFLFVRWFKYIFKSEPEIYKRAKDIIVLKKIKNDYKKIISYRYLSLELKQEIANINDKNTIIDFITENEKNIELVVYLKIIEKLIRIDKTRFILTTTISIFAVIGTIIGAIIGAAIGKEGLTGISNYINSFLNNT